MIRTNLNLTDYIGKQARTQAGIAAIEAGEWADITGIGKEGGDFVFLVRFVDGDTDSWIIGDPDDYYEFRDVPDPDADVIANVRQKLRNATTDDISDADIREIIAAVRASS